MSVSIGCQGTQCYVELNHGGKTLQIPCKDKEEAQKIAEEAQIVEQKIEAKEKEDQKVDLNKSTPQAGVGQKLDTAA